MDKITKQMQQWKRRSVAYEKAKERLEEQEENVFQESLKLLGLTTPELQFGVLKWIQQQMKKEGKEVFLEQMKECTQIALAEEDRTKTRSRDRPELTEKDEQE